MNGCPSIAIVGLGPKGLHCLERLLAALSANPALLPASIHVINRTANFGASPIYDPRQPDYILTNNSVGDIDNWSDETPAPVGGRGLNFVAWYNSTFAPARPLEGSEYLPRALVGRYLQEGFKHLLAHAPVGAEIVAHVGEAIDLRPAGERYVITIAHEDASRIAIEADHILLATGHSRPVLSKLDRKYLGFATTSPRARYIPFPYPLRETLRDIPAGARIAMKGMGLTFIDAALELTEGRGGRFERQSSGALAYIRHGAEPATIIAFSRSGLPAIPKAADLPLVRRCLTFTRPARLEAMRRAAGGRKLNFDVEVWPLVQLEMERAYYEAAMGVTDWHRQLDRCGDDAGRMREVIHAFLQDDPSRRPFDPRPVLDPLAGAEPNDPTDFHAFVDGYLDREIQRSRSGHGGCPLKAAIDIWFEIRYALESVLQFGGLTPESHERLECHHFTSFKRVVFGPPILNAEKMLALARAGIVDFGFARNPTILLDGNDGRFGLHSEVGRGGVTEVDVLIDARFRAVRLAEDATPLFQSLSARGLIRPYDNGGYQPGAIDMAPDTHGIIGNRSEVNENISVIGIPTEGNLVGNLTVTRSPFSSRWASQMIARLSARTVTA